MITTECVIADKPEDDKKMGGMPGGMGVGFEASGLLTYSSRTKVPATSHIPNRWEHLVRIEKVFAADPLVYRVAGHIAALPDPEGTSRVHDPSEP